MEVKLLPPQYDFLKCTDKIAFLIGGIGGGKSFTGGHYALNCVLNYPDTPGLIVANTYTQLSNATIPAITTLFDQVNLPYKLVMGGAKKYIQVNGTKLFIYSLEKYDNIRGIEVGWIFGDEVAFADKEAIDVCYGRLRHSKGPKQARWTTSPNGFNWVYDSVSKGNSNFVVKTKDNHHIDPEYYLHLLEQYGGIDSPKTRQELFGEFVNMTSGSVYYAFKRASHVKNVVENKNQAVYIACDFNAGNMNYIAGQFNNGKFQIFDATTLKDFYANTFSMAQDIYRKYGSRARVIPDSTARARKTSSEAGITDIKILQNAGLTVVDFMNPRIKDRHNTVNARFFKDKIEIDPSCVGLITDLETLSVDVEEGSYSHLAVCLGYMVWKLDPFTPKQISTNLTNPFLNKGK